MTDNRSLWFDFTTSISWSRPPVGVVRVEQECCRWLLQKLPDHVRLCIYDQPSARFVELDRQRAWSILTRDWSRPDCPPAAAAPCAAQTALAATGASAVVPPGITRRIERILRRVALAVLDVLPSSYQAAIRRRLVAVRRTMAYGYHEWVAARASVAAPEQLGSGNSPAATPSSPPDPSGIFSAGDCYLTMGLDWDHDKMGVLYREKRKKGLKVFNFAYDVIPVKFPHFYQRGKFDLFSVYFVDMAWTTDHVFCISACTAHDLHSFFEDVGAPNPPKTVVRLGDALHESQEQRPSEQIAKLLEVPYLLFVSTIEIRKNHETLYKAYVRLVEEGFEPPKLVLVGMPGWRVDDFMYSLRNDPRIKERVVILDRVGDADLSHLYRNCMFTLYPSLYEGWGLPVAESLAYGKFCLASNVASIPEIAGDIIDYADPWDAPQWAEKIRLYCSSPQALREREAAIASRFRTTSWEATADEMIATIDRETWPGLKASSLAKAPSRT